MLVQITQVFNHPPIEISCVISKYAFIFNGLNLSLKTRAGSATQNRDG